MKLMHKSFLAGLSAIFLGLSTATLFSFSNVQATATTKILDDTSVETAAPGNTIASDAPADATATGTSQAAVGFKEGGMQVFAPNFGFADLPLMAMDKTILNKTTPNATTVSYPDTNKYRMLVVNDYTSTKRWTVSVAVGKFRYFDTKTGKLDDSQSKMLNVSSLELKPSYSRLYFGQANSVNNYGTTDPNDINWTRAYQYDDNDTIKKYSASDGTALAGHGKGSDYTDLEQKTKQVPLASAPWEWDDALSAPNLSDTIKVVPFDDSDTVNSQPNFSAAERTPDKYFPDWGNGKRTDPSYDQDKAKTKDAAHQNIVDRYNGKATSGLNGDTFRNNFKVIWGANEESNGHYYGKGWWALDFHDRQSAQLNVPSDSQQPGTYKATMYWVLSSAPIA